MLCKEINLRFQLVYLLLCRDFLLVVCFFHDWFWYWVSCLYFSDANPPNGQKLRHPESVTHANQKTHSQNRSANEGLPPALC
jgi:hypothetical protein